MIEWKVWNDQSLRNIEIFNNFPWKLNLKKMFPWNEKVDLTKWSNTFPIRIKYFSSLIFNSLSFRNRFVNIEINFDDNWYHQKNNEINVPLEFKNISLQKMKNSDDQIFDSPSSRYSTKKNVLFTNNLYRECSL
jgi:hypothetical protein